MKSLMKPHMILQLLFYCNPYLEKIDIGYNFIQGRGAIHIAKSFQQISTLKKLFMNHNRITDEASDDIATLIHHNPDLNELRITGNLLTTSCSCKLKDCVLATYKQKYH